VYFDIHDEVSHGHCNLRDAVKLPMDCFARMAAHTRGIIADAILLRRLTVRISSLSRNPEDHLADVLNGGTFTNNRPKRPISLFKQEKFCLSTLVTLHYITLGLRVARRYIWFE
jgi:hypothetical protein